MPHSDANGNRDSHADGNSDADSDTNTDRDANSNSHVYSDSHAYGNAHTDANGYGHSHSDIHAYCDSDSHGNAHTDANGYGHRHSHSDIHAYSDGDCHSYANTDAYCDSNSNSNSNSNSYGNGDLNAHANCGEAFADAETASNDTATASVARIDKWNFSGGNSRVILANSPLVGRSASPDFRTKCFRSAMRPRIAFKENEGFATGSACDMTLVWARIGRTRRHITSRRTALISLLRQRCIGSRFLTQARNWTSCATQPSSWRKTTSSLCRHGLSSPITIIS